MFLRPFRIVEKNSYISYEFYIMTLMKEPIVDKEKIGDYLQAAEQGDAKAQYCVAECYDDSVTDTSPDECKTEIYKWYRKSAEQGYAPGQFNLGCCYGAGYGVEKDYKEAVKWFLKSALQDYEPAQRFLGDYTECGLGVEEDPDEAYRWYLKAAEQGDAKSQCELGFYHELGKGSIPENMDKAVEWYRKSAEQGYAEGQFYLGRYYLYKRSFEEARKWFHLAADQGYVAALWGLGRSYDGGGDGPVKAFPWYKKAAEKGHALSQERMGQYYASGYSCYGDSSDIKKDVKEAMYWYRKAAEQGRMDSLFRLSEIYDDNQDYEEAVQGYRKIIERADDYVSAARYRLGLCYELGHGVEPDIREAIRLYRESAGYYKADFRLGLCYEQGHGVEQDYGEAFRLYKKTADNHRFRSYQSLVKMGECYEKGLGVKQDMGQAVVWYGEAAKYGEDKGSAKFKMGQCYETGSGVAQNMAKAIEWYQEAADYGHEQALLKLKDRNIRETLYTQNLKKYLKKAEKGDAVAQYRVGKVYESKGDYGEAFKWYMKASGLKNIDDLEKVYSNDEFDGYSEALCSLGNLFFEGKGVAQDYAKAVVCYELLCDGNAYYCPDNDDDEDGREYYGGYLMLGVCYFDGKGVGQDYEQGFGMISMAHHEDESDPISWRYLGMAYLDGKGTEKDEEFAFECFEVAARESFDGGDALSQYYLGLCYEIGRGVNPDKEKAEKWYRLAAAQGNEEARRKLDAFS